jgi:hypothetical protein
MSLTTQLKPILTKVWIIGCITDFVVVVLAQIPYEDFLGSKVKIPPVPAGEYVLQFYWYWPTGTKDLLFISCASIAIVEGTSTSRLCRKVYRNITCGKGLL